MPAFNAASFFRQAIESVLAQTWTDFELIVIDDGSTDATPTIVNEYAADERLRVIVHDRNQGAPRTRNEALELARGEYLAMVDADDFCAPERFARQVAYLDARPDVDVLSTMWHVVDERGHLKPPNRRQRQTFAPAEIVVQMFSTCPIHHPTVMARTRVFCQYRYDETFPVSQDHELWSRMIHGHCFAVLAERLMFYRQHSQQATATHAAMSRGRQRVYARLLRRLGVAFEDRDLICHDRLFQFRGRRLYAEQTGRALDMDFVRWARHWLETLAAANAQRRLYPEPVFSRFMGARWFLVCRKAAGGPAGRAAWREFAGSSLKVAALSAGWDRVWARARRGGKTTVS